MNYWRKKYKQRVEPERYGPAPGEGVKPWQKIVLDIFTFLLIIGVCAAVIIAAL